MSLPKWIYAAVNGTQRERDLHEALTIAVEALKEIDPPLNSSDHGCWKIAREALRQIEALGK